MGRTACTGPQCLYKGAPLPLLKPLSPYGPYGQYRASVCVQRCTFTFTYTSTLPIGRTACTETQCLYKGAPLPLPIPLLPLWAVRPVQSLSACTTVHLYLYLYLYSPYGPYGLYRAWVPVQGCTFTFTYTYTPSMGRTAYTETECLYKGAPLPLPIPLLPLWAVRPVQSLSACTRVHFSFTF